MRRLRPSWPALQTISGQLSRRPRTGRTIGAILTETAREPGLPEEKVMQDFITIATSLLIAARMGQVYVHSFLSPSRVAARAPFQRGAAAGDRRAALR
jgi:hypothetical protein